MPYDPTNDILNQYIQPEWPAPKSIRAFTTTRKAQFHHQAGYEMFNLATHVGDDLQTVHHNRYKLCEELSLPEMPFWLNQIHSNKVIAINSETELEQSADASYTQQKNKICTILTADCLPILICNKQGSEVAAIHAGWRGLYNGVIKNTLENLKSNPMDLLVWLGPAIGPNHYEINQELKQKFINLDKGYAAVFEEYNNKCKLDLYRLAKIQLKAHGINQVYGANYCTFIQHGLFYSHRREGTKTGRMASLIWIE